MNTYKVLSIDAWRGPEGGWEWNQWFDSGTIDLPDLNTRKVLKAMRDQGFLSTESAGRVEIDDDQYNLVICDRSDHMPVFAIVYGENI